MTPEPEPTTPIAGDPVGRLLGEFAGFLAAERGLAASTIGYYRDIARRFLLVRCPRRDPGSDGPAALTTGDVNSFVLGECGRRSTGSVMNVVTALRVLLRFLHLRGHISIPLAEAVPAVAGWSHPALARALRPADVALLLDSCDRGTGAGRPDYAVLILLARLGLHAGEVAALSVDDVDWRAGQILHGPVGSNCQSKTGNVPVPALACHQRIPVRPSPTTPSGKPPTTWANSAART